MFVVAYLRVQRGEGGKFADEGVKMLLVMQGKGGRGAGRGEDDGHGNGDSDGGKRGGTRGI